MILFGILRRVCFYSPLIFYLHYEAPEEEQNFSMVMEMLRAAAIEDEEDQSPFSPRQSVRRFGNG